MGNSNCEIPRFNAAQPEIDSLLADSKTIAMVGLSNDPEKDSYQVGLYLKKHGYTIIPINPKYEEIMGEKAYPSIKDVPTKIDIIDVFRKPDALPGLTQETLDLSEKPRGFWMQLGIAHHESATRLKQAGIVVVQNKCIKIEHARVML